MILRRWLRLKAPGLCSIEARTSLGAQEKPKGRAVARTEKREIIESLLKKALEEQEVQILYPAFAEDHVHALRMNAKDGLLGGMFYFALQYLNRW